MNEQPELIGFFSGATGAVGLQSDFVVLDHQLHLSTAAIDNLVEVPGARLLKGCHDVAQIRAFLRDLHTTDHALRLLPSVGRVVR